jgi:hypothetical protein
VPYMVGVAALLMATSGFADVPPPPRCAVRVALTLEVRDPGDRPVAGAEVWYVDTRDAAVAPSDARLIGTTDAQGRFKQDLCYMYELFYCAHAPNGMVSLRYMVLKDGFGVLRLEHTAPASNLLQQGWAIEGTPCYWEALARKKLPVGRGYPLKLAGRLRPVQ